MKMNALARAFDGFRRPDLRPAWRLARAPLKEDIRDHRRTRTGPGGAWAARAASTKARAAYGGRPRALLGRLPGANKPIVEKRRLVFRSLVAWSESQRSGDTVGHGSRLPARDWLYASVEALEVIAVIVVSHLEDLWKRGR